MVQQLVFGAFSFTPPETTDGIESWVTDGTAAGTRLLKDIVVGSSGSNPQSFYSVNGKVVFVANDSLNGSELWVTDGTTAGTTLLADINPGSGSTGLVNLNYTTLGTKMLFTASTPATGTELWVTDGTPSGTMMLGDFVPRAGSGVGQNKPFSIIGDRAIFAGDSDVWSTDGTPAGTVKIFNFDTTNGNASSPIYDSFFKAGNLVNFSAVDAPFNGARTRELWVTDGSTDGTKKVAILGPENGTSFAQPIGTLGNSTFFVAQVNAPDGTSLGAELYVSDGATFQNFIDFEPGFRTGLVNPDLTKIAVAGGKLFFTREIPGASNPTELWVSDGTAAGTSLIQSFVNFTSPKFSVFGDKIVFTATTNVNGVQSSFAPWISDGTVAGTRQLLASNPTANGNSPDAGNYTEFGGKLYFTAIGGSSTGKELWVTDGTPAGTTLFKDINPGAAPSSPSNLIVVGDKLFFQATTASGREYWVSDGTPQGTVQVKDIAQGSLGSVNPGGTFASAILGSAAPPAPTYAISGAPTTAEGGALTFTVTRDIGTAAGAVALTLGGTATSGSDYTTPGLSVSFAAGETTKTVTITTLADTTAEPDETVTLTLGAVTGGGTVSTTGGTATGTITNVVPVIAGDDSFTTISSVALTFTAAELLSNDTGSTGIAGIALTSTAGGTIAFENGAYVYRAPVGFTGVDTFTYNAQGAGGVQDQATVSITVTPNPVDAVNDSFTTITGVPLTITAAELLANDTGAVSITGSTLFTATGALVGFQNGAFVYVNSGGFTGVDSFTYNAVGVGGTQDQATVFITVTPDPVNPGEDAFTTIAGVPLTITPADLTANDVGVVSIAGVPLFSAQGALVSFENGAYVYRPLQGFTGLDFFTYNAVGIGGTQVTTTVRILVTPDPVNPGEDAFTTIAGVPLTITPADLTANDVGVVSIGGVPLFSAQGALVSFENGAYVYRPLQGFTGLDFFTYNAVGIGGTQVTTTVRVLVTPDPNGNSVDANDDTFTTIAGVPLSITPQDLTSNDTGVLSIGNVPLFSANGALVSFENGAYVYRPLPGFTGTDFFTYTAVGAGGAQQTAAVFVNVTPDPVAPVNDVFTTIAGVPLSITPAELTANDTGVVKIASATLFSANGALVSFENGAYIYRPLQGFTGADFFTYRAQGIGGTLVEATVTVNVTPDPVDPADDTFTTTAGVPLTITPAELTANDVGVVKIASATLFSANGALVSFENGAYVYRPLPGFTGTDFFTYRAEGIGGTQVDATVTVTVTPATNAPPVGVADSYTTTYQKALNVLVAQGVLENDTDPNGDALHVVGVQTDVAHGTLALNANGSFTYTPDLGFVGADSFVYTLRDSAGLESTATAQITVEAPEFNVVSGTRLAQTLRGTDGSDVLLMGNTRIATMQGGLGADVFVFSETDGNRRLEAAYVRDYQVGVDAIDLAGATILRTIELRNSVSLILAGGDRDTLVIQGVNDVDQLTFTNAWSQGHLLT